MFDQNFALDDVNIDKRGIRQQGTYPIKEAKRLVFETLFEIEGWKRIQAIPLAFKSFGFDPDSVSLKYEEVELPISIGNKHFVKTHETLPRTFLVSFLINIMINNLLRYFNANHMYYCSKP